MSFSFAPDLPEFLTAAELTERWHVSRTTLWRWARSGIPGTSMVLTPLHIGRQVCFRRAAIEDIELTLEAIAAPRKPVRRRRKSSVA